MTNKKLEKRKRVLKLITENKKVFSSLLMRVFSDKPGYKKRFLEKEEEMYGLVSCFPDILNTLEQESFQVIENWLQKADKDLKVSIRNFKANDIENSIGSLQQSLEKLAKSYALYFGIFKEEDLERQVGHLPIKIYIKVIESDWIGKAATFFGVKSDPSRELEFLKPFRRMNTEIREKIIKMDKDIPTILKMHRKLAKIIDKSLSERDTKRLIKFIRPYRDFETFFKVNLDFASLIMPLSVITCVYEAPSRYPDALRKYGIIYEKTQLVKNFQEIVKLLKENIKKFRFLIKDDEEKAIDWDNVNLEELEKELKELQKTGK